MHHPAKTRGITRSDARSNFAELSSFSFARDPPSPSLFIDVHFSFSFSFPPLQDDLVRKIGRDGPPLSGLPGVVSFRGELAFASAIAEFIAVTASGGAPRGTSRVRLSDNSRRATRRFGKRARP